MSPYFVLAQLQAERSLSDTAYSARPGAPVLPVAAPDRLRRLARALAAHAPTPAIGRRGAVAGAPARTLSPHQRTGWSHVASDVADDRRPARSEPHDRLERLFPT